MFNPIRFTTLVVVTMVTGSDNSNGPAIVADNELNDVAAAVYQPTQSVIYVNPNNMNRMTMDLRQFFMAHERAHIALHHVRGGNMIQKELNADCLAVQQVSKSAGLAAVRFFARLGNVMIDSDHPSGSDRATNLLTCME
jgi:hypothetical protein